MELKLNRTDEEILALFKSLNSVETVANILEVSPKILNYYTFKSENYQKFFIRKKNGKPRTIYSPNTNIKILQQKLLYIFNLLYKPNQYAYGYIKERNIVDNANKHLKKKFILNVDLSDYFPSITYRRVIGYLVKNLKIENTAARIITKLICVEDEKNTFLPQGGVTSPLISNFISENLDKDLSYYLKRFRCEYTRYADDLTISSEDLKFPDKIAVEDQFRQVWLHNDFERIIKKNGFEVNYEKIRLRKPNQRQTVTGLIVNGSKPNVKRSYIRNLRSILYNWETKGYTHIQTAYELKYRKFDNAEFKPIPKIENVIDGKLNFLSMVKGKDDEIYLKLKKRFLKLKATLDDV
ncbi:reverse transcriptase domain-containing protein [Leptospira perdikensis]|uniref:RNA-directed DNA polymerase n=1 Tax=Leptospira perdikensis TaxID=2484948 RepID=A0A4R9JNP5_9LEPT|nr:reverse transcriptase domain-containing protein [Leptospira perdikensis]TGL45974.1 RNA-directed DNA polymerase [Leptospira perdikensis]